MRLAFFPNVTHAAALLGTKDGSFQRAFGRSVLLEERIFRAGPAVVEAIFAGEVDIAYIGPGPAVNGYVKSKGQALRIVCGAASGGAGLVARDGVTVSDIPGLSGLRVAVPQTGGSQDIALRHAIHRAGLASTSEGGSVAILQFLPSDLPARFKAKEVDAAWVPEPWFTRLIMECDAKPVLDERDLWPNRRFSSAVVVVRTQFLRQYPQLVDAFLGAHREVVARIRRDPVQARHALAERVAEIERGRPLPDHFWASALSHTDITDALYEDTIMETAERAERLGYLRGMRGRPSGVFAPRTARSAEQ